jgi:CRISPR-associated endonuclease/helicase Cas3
MIDVAQVAHTIWRAVLPRAACQAIADELHLPPAMAGRWISLWGGGHDLGKASPAFARQNVAAWERIGRAGFPCPAAPPSIKAPHGVITASALPPILADRLGIPRSLGRQIGRMVGGHHGVFPRSEDARAVEKHPDAIGGRSWAAAREELILRLAELLAVEGSIQGAARLTNRTSMYLAGLVSVADWIGSNADYFTYLVPDPDPDPREPIDWPAYARTAEARAHEALQRLGWLDWPKPVGRPPLTELFPAISTPNALQRAVAGLADDLRGPSLVVIEAPMGEGKTEAALFLADRWGATPEHGGGLYVALPTQATSNQMFGRVRRFLEHRHPGSIVNLQLLHGHAELSAELQLLRQHAAEALAGPRRSTLPFGPSTIHDEDAQAHDATVIAADWFTARKRGLLAPFGVGTVDQVLLAVLKTRHGFVRLFGLGHKTIVVDEVHAYDTYMSALLERLLHWLAALGASVVLLSATLPQARLRRLLDAYAAGRALPAGAPRSAPVVPYPRISWVDERGVGAGPVPPSGRSADVAVERIACDLPPLAVSLADEAPPPFELGAELAQALASGGCAVVICTTVGRAQRMYAALTRSFAALPADRRPEVGLFHARYPFGERDRREKLALARFGKAGEAVIMPDGTPRTVERPARAVLVATQVVEQSLDLDFDLMVSEPAPVDLLLQRLGRLHRHARSDRPGSLATPTLWLIEPSIRDGVPVFEDGQDLVYDPHILLRSWLALRGREVVRLPGEIEELVERVYGDEPCPADEPPAVQARWRETEERLAQARAQQEHKAKDAVFVGPDYKDDIFELFNPQLTEDDPTVHQTLQAVTRLGDPSVPVVLLAAAEEEMADLGPGRPDVERVRGLLERSAGLTHRGLVPFLLSSEAGQQEAAPHPSWRRSALLRHHRLLRLDAHGCATVGRYTIRLDPDLGILVDTPRPGR